MADKIESIVKKFRNGIAKITAQNAEISVCQPFATQSDEMVCGTGFLIPAKHLYLPTTDGTEQIFYFLTNAHVVEGCASKRVQLELPSMGTHKFYGTVVTACHALDFAVVAVTSEYNNFMEQQLGKTFSEVMNELPFLKPNARVLNTSKELYHSVATCGFPLDSADCHVASGRISGKHEHYLQLNSSISSGNSGGPLFNTRGEVIGICAATFEDGEGLALAIPWSAISKMLLSYKDEGQFILREPHLGIAVQNLIYAYSIVVLKDESVRGALVKNVFEKSPLKKYVKKNDVILKIGDATQEFAIDSKCLVKVPSQHDKIHFCSLSLAMLLDRNTTYVEVWRRGKVRRIEFVLSNDVGKVETIMASIEEQACLIWAGLTFTNLTVNHLESVEDESDPAIVSFLTNSHMGQNGVVLSAFQRPCSVLQQGYENLKSMTIVKKLNKTEVSSVEDMEKALAKMIKRYLADIENPKHRFITMVAHSKEEFIVDLQLAFSLEPLLSCTPGYPSELSILDKFLPDYREATTNGTSAKNKKRKRRRLV